MDEFSSARDDLAPVRLGRLARPSPQRLDQLRGEALRVRRLAGLVLRPLPVEPQNGYAPLVLPAGVDLAEAVLIRYHFADRAKADQGAIVPPLVLLELAAVAAAGQPLQPGAGGDVRQLPAGHELDVIAAREIEFAGALLAVKAPGNVDMSSGAVLIVQWEIFQERDLPAE